MADFEFILRDPVFKQALQEQRAVVRDFWQNAGEVLSGSGITLQKLPPRFTSLRHNYFSVLFISCYIVLGIPPERLALYARINHCLRAWVTACDNLLDNELKEMILTDLPEGAQVFKSVHTLMVTDRVFFRFLLDSLNRGVITQDEMQTLVNLSLGSITESGIEEAGEEGGVSFEKLTPDDIMSSVHSMKAGKLFTSTLAAPEALGDTGSGTAFGQFKKGLYEFGLACQILDDISDLAEDIEGRKYNYLAAVIMHGENEKEKALFNSLLEGKAKGAGMKLYRKFPSALKLTRKELAVRFGRALDEFKKAGLPFQGALRTAFLKGLEVLYRQPDIMARLRH